MKKELTLFIKSLVLILICAVAGYLLLVFSYVIPTERIRANIRNSIERYEDFEAYPEWAEGYIFTAIDEYTDATFILPNAIYPGEGDDGNPFVNAGLTPHVDYEGVVNDIVYALSDNYSTDGLGSFLFCYTRYWHGYLIFLKPLLSMFSLNSVRMINAIFELVLIALVLMYGVKKTGEMKLSIALMVAFVFLNPISCAMNFQLAAVLNVTLTSLLVIILWGDKIDPTDEASIMVQLFLLTGVVVAFVDFLTYPVVSLILPLLAYAYLRSCGILSVIRNSFYWGLGYGGMWFSKWVLAAVVSTISGADENPIREAFEQVAYRSGYTGEGYSYFQVLAENIRILANWPILLFVLCIVVYMTYEFYCYSKKTGVNKSISKSRSIDINRILIFLLIFLIPFGWYLVTREHSYDHAIFTFRNLSGCLPALMFMMFSMTNTEKKL